MRGPAHANNSQHFGYRFGNGQAAGQAWRLDTKQVDEARHAMHALALYAKIRCCLARPADLRANACIAGGELAVLQGGPERRTSA